MKKSLFKNLVVLLVFLFTITGNGCYIKLVPDDKDTANSSGNSGSVEEDIVYSALQEQFSGVTTAESDIMRVNYYNVGQADCIFIEFPDGKNMFIDVGKQMKGSEDFYTPIKLDLEKKGIEEINLLLATHAHYDHIGYMPQLFKDFKINYCLRPFVYYGGKYKNQLDDAFNLRSAGKQHNNSNSNTYFNYLASIKNEGCGYEYFNKDTDFTQRFTFNGVENSYKMDILTPTYDVPLIGYSNQNNYSPIMTVEYGDFVFMFTGDAEKETEAEFLNFYGKEGYKYPDVDVLKVGHHGSHSSSTPAFIKAIKPEYGVIMCGVENEYHHPHIETLTTLMNNGVNLYRSDLNGNISFEVSSTGEIVKITTEKEADNSALFTPGV